MEISTSDFGNGATKVTLVGSLDIKGAEKIDLPLAVAAGKHGSMVVDMSGVTFIASIGIRHLVMAAKAVSRSSGKFLLLAPTNLVADVLIASGLEKILPIVNSEDEARSLIAG